MATAKTEASPDSRPEWFKGVPTVIGWYYFAGDFDPCDGEFAEVRRIEYANRTPGYEMRRGDGEWETLKSGKWYGPIQIPKAPSWVQ